MGDKTNYFVIIFIMSCSRVLKFTAIGAKVEAFFLGGGVMGVTDMTV